MMLLTGCSSKNTICKIPVFPELNGNCKRDLRVILQDYVAPIEQQKRNKLCQ